MESESADVTVGIPLYAGDDPDYLRAAVDSVLNQTVQPETIHLVQDGPIPVPLAEVVQHYVEGHEGVEHVMIPENRGLSHALNVSILRTQTEYYARMDADDVCQEERLERQVHYLNRHPELQILGTAALEFEAHPEEENRVLKVMPKRKEEIQRMAHYRTPFIHPTVVFRRDVFARIGLYECRDMVDDVDLWMRAVAEDVSVANLPQPLLYYRMDEVVKRRATLSRAVREASIRLRHPTASLKLNLLKFSSIAFRLLPAKVQEWGYRNLR
jgi:glycosyltransferase involved in cell wall biosynthesis